MKSNRLTVVLCVCSFALGVMSTSVCWMALAQARNASSAAMAAPVVTPDAISQDQDEFPKLSDDRYISKFNGTKLKLNYGSWALPVDIPSFIQAAKILPLKTGGLLVNLEDTLYKLDDKSQVVWKYKEAQPITDYSLVESTGLIYGTAADNVMFILNLTNGKEQHRDSRNGSAAYGVAQDYGSDMCLVTDYFEVYREKAREIAPMNDGITCWRGEKALWHQEFPPDAQLVVNGNRILAVTKTKTGIFLNEIHPPKDAK
jgi:hypothetical protein